MYSTPKPPPLSIFFLVLLRTTHEFPFLKKNPQPLHAAPLTRSSTAGSDVTADAARNKQNIFL
jgi:hypothetical protein